jgi:hypothetical protein
MSDTMRANIRAFAAPVIARGGSPAEVRAAVRASLGVEIGEGGSGPSPLLAVCQYCGAYGGGGHGGFCPNSEDEHRVTVVRTLAQTAQRWHCYIEYREAVYSETVTAGSPQEAALAAAKSNGIDGMWTVVPGEPVTVDIVQRVDYEVVPK